MTDRKLLSIGSFSVLAGLSVPALRHYDDVGVLKPVTVDDRTGYRYYHPDQIHLGRTIRALRAVDLPIDELRDVVESDDAGYLRRVLSDHLERMQQRATTLSQQIEALSQFIEEGVIVPEPKGSRISMINIGVKDLAESRKFYEDVFDAQFSDEDHEGETETHLQASFGTWGQDNFFLIQLWEAPDYAGYTNIGFLVGRRRRRVQAGIGGRGNGRPPAEGHAGDAPRSAGLRPERECDRPVPGPNVGEDDEPWMS